MEKSCWLGNGMVLKFFTGKSLYDADEKEKEEAEEKNTNTGYAGVAPDCNEQHDG